MGLFFIEWSIHEGVIGAIAPPKSAGKIFLNVSENKSSDGKLPFMFNVHFEGFENI